MLVTLLLYVKDYIPSSLGNNWLIKAPRTVKLDEAVSRVPYVAVRGIFISVKKN